MAQDIVDIFRLMTVILVAISMGLLIHNRVKYASYYNYQERFSLRAKFFLALAPLVGLTWNLAKHAAFNVGLPFVTVGAVLLIYSSLTKPERLTVAEEYLEHARRLQEQREALEETRRRALEEGHCLALEQEHRRLEQEHRALEERHRTLEEEHRRAQSN